MRKHTWQALKLIQLYQSLQSFIIWTCLLLPWVVLQSKTVWNCSDTLAAFDYLSLHCFARLCIVDWTIIFVCALPVLVWWKLETPKVVKWQKSTAGTTIKSQGTQWGESEKAKLILVNYFGPVYVVDAQLRDLLCLNNNSRLKCAPSPRDTASPHPDSGFVGVLWRHTAISDHCSLVQRISEAT